MPDIINFEVAAIQPRIRQVSLNDDKQRALDIRAKIARICQLVD